MSRAEFIGFVLVMILAVYGGYVVLETIRHSTYECAGAPPFTLTYIGYIITAGVILSTVFVIFKMLYDLVRKLYNLVKKGGKNGRTKRSRARNVVGR